MIFHTLAIFVALFAVICHAIQPFQIGKRPIPSTAFNLIFLVSLVILGIFDIDSVKYGIIGEGQLEPWKILIIFFTVAYCAISTDITGIFDVIAHRIVNYSSGSTIRLFLFFFIFASLLTVFTSNDIVILTLTPIIFYLGKYTNLNIVPFLFAEFFAANTLSMMLLIGNPTNIILADALDLGFTEYLQVMAFPTLVASFTTYGLLYLFFRKELKKPFTKTTNEAMIPRNYINIGVSAILMILLLYTLLLSDFLNVEIWLVTTIFFGLFLAQDVLMGIHTHLKNEKRRHLQLPITQNPFITTLKSMPWAIAPMILVLFILMGELARTPIFESMTNVLVQSSNNLFSTIFSMGTVSILSANIINNQPMSVLFANILLHFPQDFSPETLKAAGYAVIISSNLAANLTPIGALAGIMWLNILNNKQYKISYGQFFRVGIYVTPLVFICTLLTLYLIFSL